MAISIGFGGKAKASKGSAIVLCLRNDEGLLLKIVSKIAGRGKVKANTWYTLDAKGELIEVDV